VHRAFGAELSRQVLPFGSVVQQPEDPGQSLALVRARSAALGVLGRIGNACAEPIEQPVCKLQHDTMLPRQAYVCSDSLYSDHTCLRITATHDDFLIRSLHGRAAHCNRTQI